ncbi:MAG: tail fiber domain-containing protein [Phycisphaerales bacterium]
MVNTTMRVRGGIAVILIIGFGGAPAESQSCDKWFASNTGCENGQRTLVKTTVLNNFSVLADAYDAIYGATPHDGSAGVRGRAEGFDGIGVVGSGGGGVWGADETIPGIGVQGNSYGMHGAGVDGYALPAVFQPDGPGSGVGVRGTTYRHSGRGVHGIAIPTTGTGIGVFGESYSASGYGVYGSSPHIGVVGLSDADGGIGLYGGAGGANSFAGWFAGRTHFTDHVGIGRETPFNSSTVFSVRADSTGYGGMYMETTNDSGKPFYGYSANGSVDAFHYYDGGSDQWRLALGSTRLSVNRYDGRVGVGTTTPSALLHVNGTAAKPGGGSWSVASDERLKTEIAPLTGALDTLLALEGVTFRYRDPEAIGELPGRRIGMVAQQVEEVMPDWVSGEESAGGYKRLTYRGFEPLAVEALRELAQENETLRHDHDELRAELEVRSRRLDAQARELAELRAVVERLAGASP